MGLAVERQKNKAHGWCTNEEVVMHEGCANRKEVGVIINQNGNNIKRNPSRFTQPEVIDVDKCSTIVSKGRYPCWRSRRSRNLLYDE